MSAFLKFPDLVPKSHFFIWPKRDFGTYWKAQVSRSIHKIWGFMKAQTKIKTSSWLGIPSYALELYAQM